MEVLAADLALRAMLGKKSLIVKLLHFFIKINDKRNVLVFLYLSQVYCCVGMLSITGHLHLIKADSLGWWLCERQLPSGGIKTLH